MILLLLLPALSACAAQPIPYKPPTLAVQVTAQEPASTVPAGSSGCTTTLAASVTPACTDNLKFLRNQTLPYGAVVKPGVSLDKRWQVENSGTCDWGEDYRLRLVSGTDLGAPSELPLYPARRGAKVTLRMTLAAPVTPGVYQSSWQAYNPQGQAFGDPIFIQIVVESANPSPG
jgi:hypothetical protein